MNFRRILVVLFLVSMIGLSFVAERGFFSVKSAFAKGNSDIENNADLGVDQSTLSQEGDCIEIDPQLPIGDTIKYEFWDYKIVTNTTTKYDTSRCLILKNVPYSGFYDFSVEAGYTPVDGPESREEEYKLVIELSDVTIEGPIILDPGKNATGEIKYGRLWIWNRHGFQYLEKGDNKIYFAKGNQVRDLNSVYFDSIKIVPPPHIVPEPKFTIGTSNTIKYMPIDEGAYAQDVICFDKTANALRKPAAQLLRKALPDSFKTATFNGLEDGHTYDYYIETYLTQAQVIRSRTTYSTQDATPPNHVTIDSMSSFANRRAELYWQGVCDSVSGVKFYEIVRYESTDGAATVVVGQMSALASCDTASFYHFTDLISDGSNLNNVYQYRINAVDKVGNRSSGVPTQLVVGIQAPKLHIIGMTDEVKPYHKGAKVTIAAQIDSLKLPESHFIKFQIARDNPKFLDDEWKPNVYFFESGWLRIGKTNAPKDTTFDLTPPGNLDSSFVDGRRYYYRARYKDLQDNYSDWSDLQYVIPDCFPPEDVPWLQVLPVVNDSNTVGNMRVTWGEAKDLTSGLQNYLIYRRVVGVDDFKLIGTTPKTFFIDSFDSIGYNRDVMYLIKSVDQVGNERKDTKQDVRARCLAAPIQFISADKVDPTTGKKITISGNFSHIVDLSNFLCDSTIANIFYTIDETEYEWPNKLVCGENQKYTALPEKGEYVIKSKVLFINKATSLWSKPEFIIWDPDAYKIASSFNKKMDQGYIQNYPNPFNSTTQITFLLDEDSDVLVEVYNLQGHKVRTLSDGRMGKGLVSLSWNSTNAEDQPVASGIYFYHIRIKSDNKPEIFKVQRMLLLK